jgi:hypothetical protein
MNLRDGGDNAFSDAMQQALAHVDAVREALERERLAVADQLEAASELRRQAEREGASMAQACLDERRAQLVSQAAHDAILALAVKHLSAGAAPDEVARWLDANAELMQHAARLVQKREMPRTPPPGPHNATLRFTGQGRGGSVLYRDDRVAFEMWWEFAMEPAIAIIGVPGRAEWEHTTGIPLDEREATLAWIGHRALLDQVPSGGVFRVASDHITLYGRS